MAAGEAADTVVAEILHEAGVGFTNSLVEDFAQGGHGGISRLYSSAGTGAEVRGERSEVGWEFTLRVYDLG